MGGPAGDDFQIVAVLELLKGFDQVAFVVFPHLAHMVKFLGVVLRQVAQVAIVGVALHLHLGQLFQLGQVLIKAVLQEGIP
jgi:hypothetical protein